MNGTGSPVVALFKGSYTCAICGSVVAFEGEIPSDCLRCGSVLQSFNPAALSDEEVLGMFWALKNEAKLRGLSTTTHKWPPTPRGAS